MQPSGGCLSATAMFNARIAKSRLIRLLTPGHRVDGLVAVYFRSLSSNICYEGDREWQRGTQTRSGLTRFAWRRPMATTHGLTRPQLSSDLGVGLSTLNKWVQQHQQDDLMSGPHEDVEKDNTRPVSYTHLTLPTMVQV